MKRNFIIRIAAVSRRRIVTVRGCVPEWETNDHKTEIVNFIASSETYEDQKRARLQLPETLLCRDRIKIQLFVKRPFLLSLLINGV
jgi:hypothetical protein